MERTTISVGVLGVSSFAVRRMIPAFQSSGLIKVTAIASRDPDKARSAAQDLSCGRAFADYDELIAYSEIDAVYIPLPNSLHYEWAHKALLLGKHVFVEKPLAVCSDQARDLFALADSRGLVLRENFAFEHHPRHQTARILLTSGRIGEIRSLNSAFCIPARSADDIRYRAHLAGGSLRDVGVYPLRAAQFFLGSTLKVAGSVLRMDRRSGVDVSGSALLYTDNGVTATVDFGFEHHYGAHYTLWGSAGKMSGQRAFAIDPSESPSLLVHRSDGSKTIPLPPQDQYVGSAQSFARAIHASRVRGASSYLPYSPWDAASLKTAELVDDIIATAQMA
ncbi:Gfo/Idh/MocA family oxidoreductase [Streptomyces sp. NPDC051133]|uniref:Gfo/Idh/MocA family protein n=1 Tax=Streptomyces sp. NPDC051133 TaxID=3155521 RepID=UPI003416C3B0